MLRKEGVVIEDWICSGYYLGDVVRSLYPFWKEKLVDICKKGVHEVILYGGIGGGKTFFANVLLLRKLYELACLGDDLADGLGIAKGSSVYFIYFSVNLTQAKFTGFQELKNMVDRIPFFRYEYRRNKGVESYLQFPNGVFVLPGSEFQHQLGMNVLGAVLDEANFRLARDKFRNALELYNVINARRLSRFVKNGEGLGLSVLISSARDPLSFVESKIEEAKGNSRIYVVSVRGYEVKNRGRGYGVGDNDGFWVFIGSGYVEPKIVDDMEKLREICRLMKIEVVGKDIEECVKNMGEIDRGYFVKVPEVYRDLFKSNVVLALRDILGVSYGGDRRLFRVVSAYEEAIVVERGGCGFREEIIELSMFDEVRLWDYFEMKEEVDLKNPRWIHVDLGIKSGGDRTGIACAKVAGMKDTEFGKLPIIEVEWMVGVEPSRRYKLEDEVPLWKIREFLIWLKERGFNVVKVSFDSFQSMDMVQVLQKKGLNVVLLSVDRNDEQYLNLVNLYLERRLMHREHSVYRRELLGLEHDRVKGKVDHGEVAGKDIADAVCGSVWWASQEFKAELWNLQSFVETVDLQKRLHGWEDFFNYEWRKKNYTIW